MARPFVCPQCGYKNFITASELEAERERVSKIRLGQPVRSFASTFSAVTAIKDAFFPKRDSK